VTSPDIGVEALNAYGGVAQVPVRAVFEGRSLDLARMSNIMMDQRSVQLSWEDPVTNAVNAAKPLVDALTAKERERIELLVTSTESGLDYSKSLATYVHEHLGLSRRCRLLEVKQACYGATGALQLAAGHLATAPGTKALIIGTDITPMDERAGYAEPGTGHGAVAVLLSDNPLLLTLDRGASGMHSFETLDTARPSPDFDLYDSDRSLLAYLECLSGSYQDYARRVSGADFTGYFDFLVMHTPFAGLVKAAHRKMMREFAPGPKAAIEADFTRRVEPSLAYPRQVGNLCSGALYLALASLIDSVPPAAAEGARVGLYSYGSGCASEFFSGVIPVGASAVLSGLEIGSQLRSRRELTFAEFDALVPTGRDCLVPQAQRKIDLSGCDEVLALARGGLPTLVLSTVENYRRYYEWR
jgi:polyketide biosynthesis 3-hydroxy-3-methylglutaryl-CoA synthase-like enzyme PksG